MRLKIEITAGDGFNYGSRIEFSPQVDGLRMGVDSQDKFYKALSGLERALEAKFVEVVKAAYGDKCPISYRYLSD